MNQLALMESIVHNSLAGAEVIGCVLKEHSNTTNDPTYWENVFYVAWQRREGPRAPMCGTHQFNINSHGDTMLIMGTYDINRPEDAIQNMLVRTNLTE